jgi:hypothetical protein
MGNWSEIVALRLVERRTGRRLVDGKGGFQLRRYRSAPKILDDPWNLELPGPPSADLWTALKVAKRRGEIRPHVKRLHYKTRWPIAHHAEDDVPELVDIVEAMGFDSREVLRKHGGWAVAKDYAKSRKTPPSLTRGIRDEVAVTLYLGHEKHTHLPVPCIDIEAKWTGWPAQVGFLADVERSDLSEYYSTTVDKVLGWKTWSDAWQHLEAYEPEVPPDELVDVEQFAMSRSLDIACELLALGVDLDALRKRRDQLRDAYCKANTRRQQAKRAKELRQRVERFTPLALREFLTGRIRAQLKAWNPEPVTRRVTLDEPPPAAS